MATSTYSPAQMYDHELNAVKGWPSPYAVDKSLPIKNDSNSDIIAGRVISTVLDSGVLKFRLGAPFTAGAALAPMPCFALANETDFDVRGDKGNVSGDVMTGLVAVGAYELESTEFDTADTYAPNTPLFASYAASAARGRLEAGSLVSVSSADQDLIVGIVSDGRFTNEYNKDVVRFWPVYMPKVWL